MELILVIIVLLTVYAAGEKAGRRVGSRKAYGVGFDRGKRSGGSSGCLIVLLIPVVLVAMAAAALACIP